MNDIIERIVNGMERQEGMPPDYDNPLNLRGCPWLVPDSPYWKFENGFWRPGDRRVGMAGGAHLVALHLAQGNSLTDFIAGKPNVYAGFAPKGDGNDPAAYISNVAVWAKIPDVLAPLWDFVLP